MRIAKLLAAASAAAFLSSCGGGDGGSSPVAPPPPPPPTLTVTLSESSVDIDLTEGESATFQFTATYSGSSTTPVVADVRVGGRRYTLAGAPVASGKSFTASFETLPFPAGGATTSEITFRLCTSANCSTVYPGSSKTFKVDLNVALGAWETFQRDAAHTGYVPVKYDTANFAPAWNVPQQGQRPSAIAASIGSVYANFPQANGRLITRALSAADGSVQWGLDLGMHTYFSAPSYSGGRLISASTDSASGMLPIQILDAKDGSVEGTVHYASQFAGPGAPTLIGDSLYLQSGYFGNVVYGYNTATAAKSWEQQPLTGGLGYIHEGQSVAADENYVYFYGISSLFVLSRADGSVVKKIADPFFSMGGTSYYGLYYGGPVLDGQGGIYTFSENKNGEVANPIAAFDFATASMRWRTAESYIDAPALRNGKLYVARGDSTIVDVIDTVSGNIVATMNVGSGESNLTSNVIVTESHVFVANESKTYAISLERAGNPVVWTANKGGDLALTPDNLLVISAASGLHAYRLF